LVGIFDLIFFEGGVTPGDENEKHSRNEKHTSQSKMKKSRADMLEIAKERAHAYLQAGAKRNAILSLLSDFDKWDIYPKGHIAYSTLMFVPDKKINHAFIDGFN